MSQLFRTSVALMLFLTGCGGYFFYPHQGRVADPKSLGIAYSEISETALGKPTLIFWVLEPRADYRATVLFMHGNAENMSTHMHSAAWLTKYGYRVVMFDYRGFGGSEGVPDIEGVHDDATRAVRFAQAQSNGEELILFGQSIGGSIALTTAALPEFQKAFSNVIAEAPFASYRSIAREKLASFWLSVPFQWLPWLLVEDEYSPIRHVLDIKAPVLLVHGTGDLTVPHHHSARLCENLGERCQLWSIPESGHMSLFQSEAMQNRLVEKLTQRERSQSKHQRILAGGQ